MPFVVGRRGVSSHARTPHGSSHPGGFRGPNIFLLARPIFSSRNRTSFFRRRIDRCRCLDRSRCSKTIENDRKVIAFPKSLPNKIDASRLSGPEHFFAGAPYISVQKSNVVFSTPNRPMPMPRSIAVLENDRKRSKNHSVCYMFAYSTYLNRRSRYAKSRKTIFLENN